jgi:predicted esterase
MVLLRLKPAALTASAPLMLPLIAAIGCAEVPGQGARPASAAAGFSANTFTRGGLMSGATATEAGCRALPDGLWVSAGGRSECLRYAAGGAEQPARTAVVHFPGDPPGVSYRFAGGRVEVDNVSEFYEHTPESRRLAAEVLAGTMPGVPVFLIGRPGMHGSSGDHARDRHTRDEVELLDAALTELRRRHGFQDFALSGFSSGGAIVANLLARRQDVRCAVIASAPLDLSLFHQRQDGAVPDHLAMRRGELADPMRSVGSMRANTTVFVLGDTRDRSVPHAAWKAWETAARRQGLRVYDADIAGTDRPELGPGETFHITGVRALEVAHACATGVPGDQLRQALVAGEPILKPQGRRLNGEEIRAAFVGRRPVGVVWAHWGTRVTLSTYWDAGGERYQFHPAHPERRIATHRWRVEGDRLCTDDDGCNAVLADGRFLHVVGGEPLRFRTTFVAAPAGPRSHEAVRPP